MSTITAIPADPLDGFVRFIDYQAARPRFFQTPTSNRHFMRHRKPEMVERGICIQMGSDAWVKPAETDQYILDLFKNGEGFRPNPAKQ
ncbi:MAG: hypothetical protein ABJL54_16140 [Halioglobus sp.]